MSKKVAWGFFANMYGPYKLNPMRITLEDGAHEYWEASGNFEFPKKLGFHSTGDIVRFTSTSKAEVRLFIKGFQAARMQLRVLCGDPQ